MPRRARKRRPSSTHRKDRVEAIGRHLLDAFEAGRIPKALAPVFIRRDPSSPMPSETWSWPNRFLAALAGHHLAAGFRQWEKLGRSVKKGERAFHILGPRAVVAEEDDPERGIQEGDVKVVGFFPIAVFGYEQTEGEPLAGAEWEREFLDALPLIEVARDWGLTVATYPGEGSHRLGYYRHGKAIALGVENLATWGHEVVHAADDRLGQLTRGQGQQLDNEVVAELGAQILLEALGQTAETDPGGAYRYLQHYCEKNKVSLLATCHALLDRTCRAVAFLLDEGARLAAARGSAEEASCPPDVAA
jgi:hypothetical protein